MINSVPHVPLDAKGILEVLRTHRPDLYRDVMQFASDYAHEALRWQMWQCGKASAENAPDPAKNAPASPPLAADANLLMRSAESL